AEVDQAACVINVVPGVYVVVVADDVLAQAVVLESGAGALLHPDTDGTPEVPLEQESQVGLGRDQQIGIGGGDRAIRVVGELGTGEEVPAAGEPQAGPESEHRDRKMLAHGRNLEWSGGHQRFMVTENTNDRVWGLLNQSIPRAPVSAPERLVSGSAPVYGVQTARFRPATLRSMLLRPSVRLTKPPVRV